MARKINPILLSLILTVSTFAAGCQSTSEQKAEESREADLHLQIGVNYLAKGNVEMAYFELTKAERLKPGDAEVQFALGTVFLYQNEYDRAIQKFEETLRLDPDHADAYNNMAWAYMKLERWDDAIEACQKALDQIGYQTPEKALTIIGWAYYRKGEPGKAVNYLNRALGIKPDYAEASNRLSQIYLEEGRLEKAKVLLSRLIEQYPGFVDARLNMGIVHYRERDFRAARKEFQAVLRLADRDSKEAELAKGYLDLIE